MKKYTLSETETIEWAGHILHKVFYTNEWLDDQGISRDCISGGWIESESNLPQDTCAMVCGNAKVYGNATVYGHAMVYGNAMIYGDAEVYGNAKVYGDTEIYGDADVYGNAVICGIAMIYGDAEVYGNARVYGDARVSQGITTSMHIRSAAQWHEYQYRQAELQRKWDVADGKVER